MVVRAPRAPKPKVRRRPDGSCKRGGARRRELEARFAATYGRSPRAHKLDNLEGFVLWIDRCRHRDGDEILRSVPQIVRAMKHELGWQPAASVKATRARYRTNIKNQLDTLVELGWLESWEAVYRDDGEGVGILLRVSADVAQLAKAPARRRGQHANTRSSAPPRRRAFSDSKVVSPSRGCVELRSPQPVQAGGACAPAAAEPPPDGRERAALYDSTRTALAARRSLGLVTDGPDALAALPWIADVPASIVARAALATWHPEIPPRITAKRQRQLESAVARLDRYANFGKGGEGVGLWRLLVECQRPSPPWEGAGRPRSLGAVALVLDRESKRWRRAHKSKVRNHS